MEEQHGDSSFDSNTAGEDAEMYLLKWNAHQNHFASKFSELLDEDDISFADVTLACEGNFLQAHRLVLSVCSPYFKNLFKVNCAEKGPATIVIANVRYTDLENILHFMYRGQVNVRKEDLNKFLETGEQLQIDGLMGQYNGKQNNNAASKRRFSEGGQVNSGVRSAAQQIMTNRNGRASLSQQYKIGNNGSSRLSNASTNSQQSNHVDGAKKPRVSPTGTFNKQEAAASNSLARRPSTSSHVSNANSSGSPVHPQKVDDEEAELESNNGIKIMSVASMTGSSNAAGYEGQGNEVYEILDYEGEDGNEMEMDESDLMAYGEDGDEAMYYYAQGSTSPYARSSQNASQQRNANNPQVTARYPSIIDGVHFELISADEKRVAAQCKLCPGEKVIRGSGLTSSNFISHLRAFHKRELEEWREKRKTESRRRMGLDNHNPAATATMNSLNALF